MNFLKRQLNTAQLFGSGLALILLCLILYFFYPKIIFIQISVGLVILVMIWPALFRYFGLFWFAFGEAMGYVVSRVLLSIIYLLIVLPVSLFKRKKLRENMKLNIFKNDKASVFKNRDYLFSEKDFEKPF